MGKARTLGLLAACLVLVCVPVPAQHSHGFVFAAPGGYSCGSCATSTVHFGGGGEGILGRGFGVAGELGILAPMREVTEIDSMLGVGSVNLSYHFRKRKIYKLDPFVTGGYTVFFRSGATNAINYGGGVNYWFSDHVGVKVEFRDHKPVDYSEHIWGVRIGLTFRGGG